MSVDNWIWIFIYPAVLLLGFLLLAMYYSWYREKLQCPQCGKSIKAGFLAPKKVVRCKCGAVINLAGGFLHSSIVDWEKPTDIPSEQQNMPSKKEQVMEQKAGNAIALILGLMILVAANIGIINFIIMLFNSERTGDVNVNNLHTILIVLLVIVDSVVGLLLVRKWQRWKANRVMRK